jgi:hypothetical protein
MGLSNEGEAVPGPPRIPKQENFAVSTVARLSNSSMFFESTQEFTQERDPISVSYAV